MLKLNTSRSFPAPVTVHFRDEDGKDQKGQFNAVFKVIPADQLQSDANHEKRLLDLVLVSVSHIELADENGESLQGNELLEACKNDPAISTALMSTYSENVAKKNLKRT
jgi:hypothetical protein